MDSEIDSYKETIKEKDKEQTDIEQSNLCKKEEI
jgi:hypothetical protein